MKLKGAVLRDARERLGMTQDALAAALGMTRVPISKAENEEDVAISTGRRLCEFFGLELSKTVLPRISEEKEKNGDAA
jgi:transcriptional regulator with XRE-family HTH domain